MEENKSEETTRDEVYSKVVRAGKRTYFFDVKATRSNEHYLTITESKKRFNEESGKFFYEKHKVFLYKEDFEKFAEGLNECTAKISELNSSAEPQKEAIENSDFTDVKFDDLGDDKE